MLVNFGTIGDISTNTAADTTSQKDFDDPTTTDGLL